MSGGIGDSFTTLASMYGSFLAALGGVSVTILAIVLGFRTQHDKSAIEPHIFELLVTTLVMATLACFVGAHLMAETSCISPLSDASTITNSREYMTWKRTASTDSPTGTITTNSRRIVINEEKETSPTNLNEKIQGALRLLIIASPCLYMATILFVTALVLLPTSYNSEQADLATAVGLASLCLAELGAIVWNIHLIYALQDRAMINISFCILISSIAGIIILLCRIPRIAPLIIYGLCVLVVALCMIFFAFTFTDRHLPDKLDTIIYCTGSLSTTISLVGLTIYTLNPKQLIQDIWSRL